MRLRIIPVLIAALGLAACGAPAATDSPAATGSSGNAHSPTAGAGESRAEVATLNPRAVLAHEGGLTTIDVVTGEVVGTTELDGFLRLNPAGDGRHVLVTNGDRFQVFDAGLDAEAHEDHFHYYLSDPVLTDVAYDAPKAGHVVVHDGYTVLFGDGDGSIQIVETSQIAAPDAEVVRMQTNDPHHGVAVRLADGSVFHTQGTTESRNTIQVVKDGSVLAETTDCPGSHGEAAAEPTAGGDVIVMGCTNGPVIFRDGAFHKVPVGDEYARSGNLAGSESSPIVLGDYKVDKDAKPERPTRVALIDTRTDSLSLVELGSSYWFRSLGRGPGGEGLVLTYDGALKVIDVNTGEVTASIAAIEPWQEKTEWQQPGPILRVAGERAYITDAEQRELVVIDLISNQVIQRFQLEHPIVEMAVVTGHGAAGKDEH